MKIARICCYEVIVPAHKGAINSEGVNKPLHKLERGVQKAWSVQFDKVPKLVVKLELESGIVGWGELYRDHDWRNVESICKILLGTDIQDISLQKLPFAFCREYDGFECAIWDAYARLHDMPVVDLLGGPVQDKVKVGAWSSFRHIDEIADIATKFNEKGYDCLKFKCDLQDDVVTWSKLISDCVPGMKVILDPNERWNNLYDAKRKLSALSEIGNILCVEDPIPRWKLDDYFLLRGFSAIPVVLHVALPYLQHGQRIKDAIQAVQLNAVDGFNFNCGLNNFQLLSNIAEAAQMPCWHGSEIDLGILEAMYIHSSIASASCTFPGDIFGRMIREHDLLKTPLDIQPPYAYLPNGPGLGINVDEDAINYYLQHKKEYI
ncbi:mandelate racemase/muconate lactonizing enzyme family protein [Membranihabitans maritimus]|uniref:mandelate racemase/muconate lactonizing enzyme family protein n=1 Tax=Membranihabitans maritimus TaxID=2904244 RepID=UPI001F357D73|nr:mandelate racemase/muconate lactonizing enzyme family protein [Membranihabitans maritimus]